MRHYAQTNAFLRRAFRATAAVLAIAAVAVVAVGVCVAHGIPVAATAALLSLLPLANVTVEEVRRRVGVKPPDGFADWGPAAKGLWYQANGILAAAEQGNRDLTEGEAREVQRLEAQLARTLSQSRGRRSDPDHLADEAGNGGLGARGLRDRGDGAHWVDANTGEQIRVYHADERMAGPAAEGIDLGLLVRGMVLGRWHGAEREQRAMVEGLDTSGGYTVPEPLAPYILDLARAKAVCIAAGMLTVPMTAEQLAIARVTGEASASWRVENADISDASASMTFGRWTLYARSCAVMVKMSEELVADAPNVGEIVEDTLAAAGGLALDYACLMGNGAGGQPTGIYNTEDVQELTAIGVPALDDFLDAITKIREENHEPNAVILHPTYWGLVEKLKDGEGQYIPGPPSFVALKHLASTQVPKTLVGGAESVGFVGDFTKLLLGLRQSVRIEASRHAADSTDSAFRKNQVWIRAVLRADVCPSYEKAFCLMKGLTEA